MDKQVQNVFRGGDQKIDVIFLFAPREKPVWPFLKIIFKRRSVTGVRPFTWSGPVGWRVVRSFHDNFNNSDEENLFSLYGVLALWFLLRAAHRCSSEDSTTPHSVEHFPFPGLSPLRLRVPFLSHASLLLCGRYFPSTASVVQIKLFSPLSFFISSMFRNVLLLLL